MTLDQENLSSLQAVDLILAMAPQHLVFDNFRQEARSLSPKEQQDKFACLLQPIWKDSWSPSKIYLKNLISSYFSSFSESEVESDALWDVFSELLHWRQPQIDSDLSCYVSFLRREGGEPPLRIRIFPHHNDVALRIWEAGAYLSEYLLANPGLTRNRKIVELGAGTGVSGLMIAGLGSPSLVICTDFTTASLTNMRHNVDINREWLQRTAGHADVVKSGYLEWEEFSNPDRIDKEGSLYTEIEPCNTLVAADVIYDPTAVPALVGCIGKFMMKSSENVVIIATTRRNQETFEAFVSDIESQGFRQQLLVSGNDCDSIPIKIPMKFNQPRSDVSIYRILHACEED